MGAQLTTAQWIEKAISVHGDRYNYSKVDYINAKKEIIIVCKDHGEFLQKPSTHIKCSGCPKCGGKFMDTEYFKEKSSKIHNNKYDYSKSVYIKSTDKIIIICPEHGEFLQTPSDHLSGYGCSKCVGKYKPTTEEWIQSVQKVHNYKYTYEKCIYTTSKNKVIITCPIHGDFEQTAGGHLKGQGCRKCYNDSIFERTSKSEIDIIKELLIVHNNYYSYPNIQYSGNKYKINITCPIHGNFQQLAGNHLKGAGCPKCNGGVSITKEDFINKAYKVHGNLYDYSLVEYINSFTKVKIICKQHGIFEQSPDNHVVNKQGCSNCWESRRGDALRYTNEDFIEKANLKHSNKYDYSKVDYNNSLSKVIIICREHGEFLQIPSSHLAGTGCPICNYSKGELLIYNWLKENKIRFKPQFELITPEIARSSNLMLIDFFVIHNEKQYFIEYDGIQHFEYIPHFHKEEDSFFKQQRRDRVLNDFCELHKDKVTLIRFRYDDVEVVNKLKNIFSGSKTVTC